MKLTTRIIDITESRKYEKYLYKCLAPIPFRKYRNRHAYLEAAIPRGFHKKLLLLNGQAAGQIEYAPAEVSGYPISGNNIITMNCIWVLRKAKGHTLGRRLLTEMIKNEQNAVGFSTIGLENHWSPWMKKEQMEKFGFKSLDSIEVRHKTKHKGQRFQIHLMWLPITEKADPPTWNKPELIEGVNFCLAHPLYNPEEKPQLQRVKKTSSNINRG